MFLFLADVISAVPVIRSGPVIDLSALHILLMRLTGWLDRREREAVAFLIEENRSCGAN